MNLHLYHAIKYASLGAEQMSGAAWASALCDGTTVENGYIATAREYLARATAELNAYDAKRQEIKPANAAAEITRPDSRRREEKTDGGIRNPLQQGPGGKRAQALCGDGRLLTRVSLAACRSMIRAKKRKPLLLS
jgi:hypothetical protein